MFNLAIDSKLRGCDVVALKGDEVAPSGYAATRASVRQKKTGRPVKFELTESTHQAIDDYLRSTCKKPGDCLFTDRRRPECSLTTRQYARLLSGWLAGIGLDPHLFGTHSLRRTKATLIYGAQAACGPCSFFWDIRKLRAPSATWELRSMTRLQ
jgi:integrase